ncbi:hypothetical protein [Sphingorhabdus sp. Alg239-R122]|uniref:hypothetical protein n=1 Tax=Sphingorhabdus sp. Alg239-R122 TaxID=2305989 RepID=UPI0013D9C4CB|nr:hypothetical protein [Sphingorhabdus sp. Alg239-R122]
MAVNQVKARNTLVLVHLFLAALLAPSFIMVAVTGTLDLAKIEPEIIETPLTLPADRAIDPGSPSIEQDIRLILDDLDIDSDFESLRVTEDRITTRPTSQNFVRFAKTPDGWHATHNRPGLYYSMMELHKGHGPAAFKLFQIFAGIALFCVVIGGLAVGLLSRAYRRKTIFASSIGLITFLTLAYLV